MINERSNPHQKKETGATRQAVIIIHGIGEQAKKSTLKGFVESIVLGSDVFGVSCLDEKGVKQKENLSAILIDKSTTWNELKGIAEEKETQNIKANIPIPRYKLLSRNRKRPRTDFFEYHWAHHSKENTTNHVFSWLIGLFWETKGKLPKPISSFLFKFFGSILIICIPFFVLVILDVFSMAAAFFSTVLVFVTSGFFPQLGFFIFKKIFNFLLVNFAADAARYLDTSPKNEEFRTTVIKEGLKLVKAIHDSKKYDRVVIVAHSLGTVIAYDIIKAFWINIHEQNTSVGVTTIPYLEKVNDLSVQLEKEMFDPDHNSIKEFREHDQFQLWQAYNQSGMVWKITDFITLGSPLTYANLLLKKRNEELLLCPPRPSSEKNGQQIYYEIKQGNKRSIIQLQKNAPFALTRWVNIYFPGDIIGGPLAPVFGPGVKDVVVTTKEKLNWRFEDPSHKLASHSWYWAEGKDQIIPYNERPIKEIAKYIRPKWLEYQKTQMNEQQQNKGT